MSMVKVIMWNLVTLERVDYGERCDGDDGPAEGSLNKVK